MISGNTVDITTQTQLLRRVQRPCISTGFGFSRLRMKEIWKKVKGYEVFYEVSNTGRVKSLRQNKIMKTDLNKGYQYVILCGTEGQKMTPVHHIVLNSFIGYRPEGYQTDHINGIRNDNRINNLRWVTVKENAENRVRLGNQIRGSQNYNSVLTEEKVQQIAKMLKRGYRVFEIYKKLDLNPDCVKAICRGKNWSWLTGIKYNPKKRDAAFVIRHTCESKGCGRKHSAKGLCQKHYSAFRRSKKMREKHENKR